MAEDTNLQQSSEKKRKLANQQSQSKPSPSAEVRRLPNNKDKPPTSNNERIYALSKRRLEAGK